MHTGEKKQHQPLITEVAQVQNLLDYHREKALKLLHLHRGFAQANMRTHGLYLPVNNQEIYVLHQQGLTPVTAKPATTIIELELAASQPKNIVKPPALEIAATWENISLFSGVRNNILGDNGQLSLTEKQIAIPTLVATPETLAYYGAVLIKPGDNIRFPDPIYPIWSMTIDENYVNDFLLQPEGGGFYLEYHHDQPHYHHAISGSGHYLLAKWNTAKTHLQITGFKLPTGHAVYTKKGAIHCDAALVGIYLVGYTTSENCSTVLLRSQQDGAIVKINFV